MKTATPSVTSNSPNGSASIAIAAESALAPPDSQHPAIQIAAKFTFVALLVLMLALALRLFWPNGLVGGLQLIGGVLASEMFWIAVAVGALAQAVDGALGMAYGVTATTFLLSSGASPAVASASVHIAEVFTTGFSGLAHVKYGNIDRKMFFRLLVPGVIGGILGAIVVTQIDGKIFKPYVTAYLLVMGLYLLARAARYIHFKRSELKHTGKLAAVGGFVDAAGGGGWGPIVTTTLLSTGQDPRLTIGTVNFAEFFLTLASAATFTLLLGTGTWPIVAGLIVGGLISAPFAALLCRRVPARLLLTIVGLLITSLSLVNLYQALSR